MRDKGSRRLHAFGFSYSQSRRFSLGLSYFGARRLLYTFYPVLPRPRVDFSRNTDRTAKRGERIPDLGWNRSKNFTHIPGNSLSFLK